MTTYVENPTTRSDSTKTATKYKKDGNNNNSNNSQTSTYEKKGAATARK